MDLDISHQTGLPERLGFLLISWTSKPRVTETFQLNKSTEELLAHGVYCPATFYLKD